MDLLPTIYWNGSLILEREFFYNLCAKLAFHRKLSFDIHS